ncbi:MAG: KilA-N domain-containing protein [Waterburya sp.]
MSNLTYNGQIISQRKDGYVNATQMCKANTDYDINQWLRNQKTQEYLESLALNLTREKAGLVFIEGSNLTGGKITWVHPLMALNLGRWISPDFAIWCDTHIKTLMETGSTTLVEQPKPVETKLMVANELRLLNESTLPAAVKQLLIDSLMNEYITQNQPVLEASKERWVGCAQKAEEMGYVTNQSTRGKLGKFVKGNSEDLITKQEERLCNGMMRSIWVYLDSPELEVVIHDYFNPEVY